MIAVVDLGIANVDSVAKALSRLGAPYVVTRDRLRLEEAEKLIFPGVGNFAEASKRLLEGGIAETIREQVLGRGKPILGICLGMQLLAQRGDEGGGADGLGLIDAEVRKIPDEGGKLRLPHIGWNDVDQRGMGLFAGVPENSCFYFVHSYHMALRESGAETAVCRYGRELVVAVKKKNIIGVQFHPEKSQKPGLRVLENFLSGRT